MDYIAMHLLKTLLLFVNKKIYLGWRKYQQFEKEGKTKETPTNLFVPNNSFPLSVRFISCTEISHPCSLGPTFAPSALPRI